MQLVNLGLADGSEPNGNDAWQINAIEKKILILDLNNKYNYYLIPKFTPIVKGARLTSERLAKRIIKNSITAQKKDDLTKMLYN